MKVLVLSSNEISSLLNLDELRGAMGRALISISKGETQNFARNVFEFDKFKALGIMPAHNGALKLLGYKAVTVFKDNNEFGLNPHQGIVTLLDYNTGQLKCIAEGSSISALRTAAVSAFATDILSLKASKTLAIIGAGRQAYEHIRSICKIRQIEQIQIYNRNRLGAERLIKSFELAGQSLGNPSFHIANSATTAVKDADIVVTCTPATQSHFETSVLKPGCHINAIGACRPGQREIEIRNQTNVKIILDDERSCKREADEVFLPIIDKSLTHMIHAELGEVASALKTGREFETEITIFKSVGLAVEDLFCLDLAYQSAISKLESPTEIVLQ